MKVLLDTNFIVSCVKAGFDFLEAENFGKLVLAKQVLEELKTIDSKDNKYAKLAIKIINENINKFELISLNFHFVDIGILNYAAKNKVVVATLDKELKAKLGDKAQILVLRGKKKLELV